MTTITNQQDFDTCVSNRATSNLHITQCNSLTINFEKIHKNGNAYDFDSWVFDNNEQIIFENFVNITLVFNEPIAKNCIFRNFTNCRIALTYELEDEHNMVISNCSRSIFCNYNKADTVEINMCEMCSYKVQNMKSCIGLNELSNITCLNQKCNLTNDNFSIDDSCSVVIDNGNFEIENGLLEKYMTNFKFNAQVTMNIISISI